MASLLHEEQNPKSPENEYMRQLKAEQRMKIGDFVMAFWSAGSGGHFHGKGVITEIREKSILVGLTEEVKTSSGEPYPKGHHITIPRVLSKAWKQYLRFEPTAPSTPAATPAPTITPPNQKLAYDLVEAFEKKMMSGGGIKIDDHAGQFMGDFYVKYMKVSFPLMGLRPHFFKLFNFNPNIHNDTIILVGAYIDAISGEAGWENAIETTDVLDDWGIIQSPVGQVIINNKITRDAGLFLLKSTWPLQADIQASELELFREQIRDDLERLVKQGLLKPLPGTPAAKPKPKPIETEWDDNTVWAKLNKFFKEENPEAGAEYDVNDLHRLTGIPVGRLKEYLNERVLRSGQDGKPIQTNSFKEYLESKYKVKIDLEPGEEPEPPEEPEENPLTKQEITEIQSQIEFYKEKLTDETDESKRKQIRAKIETLEEIIQTYDGKLNEPEEMGRWAKHKTNPASPQEIAKAKKVVHRFTAFEAKNIGTTKLDMLNKKTKRLNSWNTALYKSDKWSGKEKGYYHPWGDNHPRSVFITDDGSHVIGIGQAVVKPDGINDMPIYKGKGHPTLEAARRVKVWAKLADTLGMDLPCSACGTTLHYEEESGWVCDKCKGPSEPQYKITGGPVLYDAQSQILISIGKVRKSGD